MGNIQSASAPPPSHQHTIRRPQSPLQTLDEKLDAVRIDIPTTSHHDHKITSTRDDPTVSLSDTETYISTLLQNPKNRLALSALSKADPAAVLEQTSTITHDTQHFNVRIPLEGAPVTDQGKTGRCWLFAATNVFRVAIQQKYGLASFELSQAYLFFWDKVEKANWFLEMQLRCAEQELDSRLVETLNVAPVSDGGQWDLVVNLVCKYGIVPKGLYRDLHNATDSGAMDKLLGTKLREDGIKLREMKLKDLPNEHIRAVKDRFMQQVVTILTLTLGPPPQATKKFTWEYSDRSGRFKSINISPLEFAASTKVDGFISLVNDPRNEYNTLLIADNHGNVWDGRAITFVNVNMNILRAAAVGMLRKGLPIYFGCDVSSFSDREKGIMDTELIDYELGFNVKLGMTKAQRLLTRESAMNHAMVLTAVHIVDNKPVRWRVQNSWGYKSGSSGYFVMSDKWMSEFVYQVVVDPSVVDDEVKDILNQDAKHLPRWDPMGALA